MADVGVVLRLLALGGWRSIDNFERGDKVSLLLFYSRKPFSQRQSELSTILMDNGSFFIVIWLPRTNR